MLRWPLCVLVLTAAVVSAAPPEPTRTRRFEGELTKVSEQSISVRPV